MGKTFILLTIICIGLMSSSCESDVDIASGADSIIMNDQSANIIINESGINTFTFSTDDAWTATIIDTAQTEWLTLSQQSGEKGQNSIDLKALPNYNLSDRNAYLSIKSGNAEVKVGVLQKMGSGVTDIPFANDSFRAYCIRNFDLNKDGLLSFEEAQFVFDITLYSYNTNMPKGMEYFLNLRDLHCYESDIKEMDLRLYKKLESLNYIGGKLEKLDLSQNTELKTLKISDNTINDLDLSKNTKLQTLDVSYNNLTELNLSNLSQLTSVYINSNQLTVLDLANCNSLTYLYCDDNKLTQINLESCFALETLYLKQNDLKILDLRTLKNLRKIYTQENPNLKEIWVPYNSINQPEYYKDDYTILTFGVIINKQ